MEKKKTIWNYFEGNYEYPKEIAHNPIPYGTVWTYVSATFLNGFINYVNHKQYKTINYNCGNITV